MRKLVTLPSLLALFFSPTSLAIDLGNLQLQSALGQPLALEIPIHLGQDQIQLEHMHVALRSGIDSDARNLPAQQSTLPASKMVAELTQSTTGNPVIHIHTQGRVDTPYIRLIVDLKTPKGQFSKEYTVLLDPPEFAAVNRVNEAIALNTVSSTTATLGTLAQGKEIPAKETAAQAPSAEQAPSAAQAPSTTRAASVAVTKPYKFYRTDESRQIKKARPSLLANTWKAFTGKAPAAAVAKGIPVYDSPQRASLEEDEATIRPENIARPATATAMAPSTTPSRLAQAPSVQTNPREYGPTIYQETLWSIVQKLRDDHPDLTSLQMEHAILTANPEAFIDRNIHALKAGVILTIPTTEKMKAMTVVASNKARKQTGPAKLAKAKKVLKNPTKVTGGLANKTKTINITAAAQSNSPVIITQLASATDATSATTSEVDAGYVQLAKRGEAATPRIAADVRNSDPLPAKFAVHSESARQDYSELFISMQREIAETIKRLDALQEGQVTVVNKTTTLEAKQQNLQTFLDTKQIELASVESRLTQLNQQLTGLLSQVHLTQPQTGITAQVSSSSPQSSSALTSLFGFGLLTTGLVGGAWYVRRRQWQQAAVVDETHPVHEYDEMNEQFAQSSHRHLAAHHATASAIAQAQGVDRPAHHAAEDEAISILDEVNVYLAHGRFEQAEIALKDAIKQQPQCCDYHLKLLEIYATTNNIEGFESTRHYITQTLQVTDQDILQTIHTLQVLTWPDAQPAVASKPVQHFSHHDNTSLTSSMLHSAVFAPPLADIDMTQSYASAPKKAANPADSLPFSFSHGDNGIFERAPASADAEPAETKRVASNAK